MVVPEIVLRIPAHRRKISGQPYQAKVFLKTKNRGGNKVGARVQKKGKLHLFMPAFEQDTDADGD